MCELCLSPFIIRDTNHVHHQNEHQDKTSESDHEPSTANHQESPNVSAPTVPLVEVL